MAVLQSIPHEVEFETTDLFQIPEKRFRFRVPQRWFDAYLHTKGLDAEDFLQHLTATDTWLIFLAAAESNQCFVYPAD